MKRLGLSADDRVCTRDEFTLLLLVLQGKVAEKDIDECRAAFEELDETKSGTLTAEDLELVVQRRMLRLAPKLRRRRLRQMRESLSNVWLSNATSMGIRDQAEAIFPYWARGRGEDYSTSTPTSDSEEVELE